MKKILFGLAIVLGIVSCGGGGAKTTEKKEQKLVFMLDYKKIMQH